MKKVIVWFFLFNLMYVVFGFIKFEGILGCFMGVSWNG